jgi:hypothetical protein
MNFKRIPTVVYFFIEESIFFFNYYLTGVQQLWIEQVERQVALDDARLSHLFHFLNVAHYVAADPVD